MRRLLAVVPAAVLPAAALAVVGAGPLAVAGSTPASGAISYASPTATWTGSGMTGSAPDERRKTCNEPTACDYHGLHIDTKLAGTEDRFANLHLVLTPSDTTQMMDLVLYPPGCSATDPTAPTCYSIPGNDIVLSGPQNGDWTIGVSCTLCVNGGYTITATLAHVLPHIPALGDQSFGWAVSALPRDPQNPANTSFGEPGISINQHGKVVVNTFGPTVWISKDDGKSFAGPQIVDPTPCNGLSGDADAQVAFDDTYYVDNLCLAGGTNLMFASNDDGATWNPAAQGLPSFAGTDVDRQWIAVDPKNAGTVYMEYHDLEGPNIWVLKSTDHAQTFTQLTPITLEASKDYVDTSQGNTTSRLLVDPTDPNTLSVLYANNTAEKSATAPPTNQDFDLNRFFMAQSHDGGMTWTNTDVFDAGQTNGQDNTVAHEFPQSTVDSAGNIYVIFSERRGGETESHIMMGVIPHGATAMRTPVQVDQGGLGANVFAWAAAGDPGMIDITWYGTLARDNNDHTAQWSEMFAQSVDALSASPHFIQSRMGGDEPMHDADICLAGTLCAVTMGNRNLADFQGVALDPCGNAEAVWTDDHTGDNFTLFARQTAGRSIRPSACAPNAASTSGAVQGATTTPSGGVQGAHALPNTAGAAGSPAAPALAVAGLAAGAVGWRRRRARRTSPGR